MLYNIKSPCPPSVPPFDSSPGWQEFGAGREVGNTGTVVFVVMSAVGELFLEALADEEAVVGIDGQVAVVEEGMEVRA